MSREHTFYVQASSPRLTPAREGYDKQVEDIVGLHMSPIQRAWLLLLRGGIRPAAAIVVANPTDGVMRHITHTLGECGIAYTARRMRRPSGGDVVEIDVAESPTTAARLHSLRDAGALELKMPYSKEYAELLGYPKSSIDYFSKNIARDPDLSLNNKRRLIADGILTRDVAAFAFFALSYPPVQAELDYVKKCYNYIRTTSPSLFKEIVQTRSK